MAKKSLNKLGSTAMPTVDGRGDYQHHSISARKIDNGYIVSRSSDTPKGYMSSETYHPKMPKLEATPASKADAKEDAAVAFERKSADKKADKGKREGSPADKKADAKAVKKGVK